MTAQKAGRQPRAVPASQGWAQLLQHVALDLKKLIGDQDNIAVNLTAYVQAFSPPSATSSTASSSPARSTGLARRPAVPGHREVRQLRPSPGHCLQCRDGPVFEELIRKFAELSNETAGEHFTPREVIRLMVNLLFVEDDDSPDQARRGAHHLRPGSGHRRNAVRGWRVPGGAQP